MSLYNLVIYLCCLCSKFLEGIAYNGKDDVIKSVKLELFNCNIYVEGLIQKKAYKVLSVILNVFLFEISEAFNFYLYHHVIAYCR